MAQIEYVKVWTEFLKDPWVIGLTCNQRGFYLQLFLMAKMSADSGRIFAKSYSQIGHASGCDDSTARKILRKFADDGKIELKQLDNGVLEINVLKYQFWQGLSPSKEGREQIKNQRIVGEKSPEIPPLHRQRNNIEEEAPPPETDDQKVTRLIDSFNAYVDANVEKLKAIWSTNYSHIGGVDQLKDCTREIREAITLNPNKENWERHARERSWGDLIRTWNKNKVRARETR